MKSRVNFALTVIAAISLLTTLGCQKSPSFSSPSLSEVLFDERADWSEKSAFFLATTLRDETWQKRWWISKTARFLRAGQGIGPADKLDELVKLSEEEIVRHFMNDERFGDTLLDFNMYYLGFKTASLYNKDPSYKSKYSSDAFEVANAVAAAKEGIKDGDYFKLFNLKGPLYFPPTPNSIVAIQAGANSEELRAKKLDKIQTALQNAILAAEAPNAQSAAVCQMLSGHGQLLGQLPNLRFPFIPFIYFVYSPDWYGSIEAACTAPIQAPSVIAALLRTIYEKNERLFNEVRASEPSSYNPQRISEFREVDLDKVSLPNPWLAISLEQSQALTNSSTNFNRKRAAYILKRYFCDDLTAVGVDDPAEHTGGAHGSDTACYSCHYKLEPMAGFFRNFGIVFFDFTKLPQLIFDDNAIVDRAKYEENWRAKPESGRTWNIGYIRSTAAGAKNIYGESLDNLAQIIREAPEAKQCLVRRLFEYFVAEKQTVDAGYLNYLSEMFAKDAAVNSSKAVKNTILRLVTSQAYSQKDLDPKKCYDADPRDAQKDTPPCRVAYLIKNNCAECHKASDDPKYGYLDLTKWVAQSNGVMSFPHEDAFGQQRSPRETFAAIISRLSTSDAENRMPYKRTMLSQDRQELFQWAQEVLNTLPVEK